MGLLAGERVHRPVALHEHGTAYFGSDEMQFHDLLAGATEGARHHVHGREQLGELVKIAVVGRPNALRANRQFAHEPHGVHATIYVRCSVKNMEIESGDSLSGPEGPRYCEVAAVLDNHLEVWPEKRGWLWQYNDEWCTIPISKPTRHVKPKDRDYRAAYRILVRALDGVSFVKTSEENQIPPHVTLPVGVDTDSEEEEARQSDLDFIASDDEEEFSFADTDYAKETHAAVREYNPWQPTTPDGQRIKAFIDYLDHKYCQPIQENLWWAGHSINYTKPPV